MKILGLMSGTSLDGIDAALLEIEEVEEEAGGSVRGPGLAGAVPRVRWEILAFRTRPFASDERRIIAAALGSGGPRELALLHTRLGEWLAQAAVDLLRSQGVSPETVAAVGSHGQTVWHEPPEAGIRGSSLQLGCPATIAERTGIGVVSDFRARDLAAGGQGAPLVPWADRILFSSREGPRALQNLGGMANVTWLPRLDDPAPILAFDTGPGVALLNLAAELATDGAWAYDRDGALSRRGEAVDGVLAGLKADPFFQQAPPRSTGRERFGVERVRQAVRELERELGEELVVGSPNQGWPHLFATLEALTAWSIGEAYRKWVLPRGVDDVFLMGGGSRNPSLVEAIKKELAPVRVSSGEALGMNPDAREAAAFALLAWAHVRSLPANVPEATGSSGLRVLGSWTPGRRG